MEMIMTMKSRQTTNSLKTLQTSSITIATIMLTALVVGMVDVQPAEAITCNGSQSCSLEFSSIRLPTSCAFSTSSTSFVTVGCSGTNLSQSYTCGALKPTCGVMAVVSFQQFTGSGDFFFTELRVDGSTMITGFDQCIGSPCALDDRDAALSVAEPVTAGTSDTFALVARVGSSFDVGTIDDARLNLVA